MKKMILWVSLGLVVVGGMVYVMMPRHQEHQEVAEELWYCPMHPHYTSEKPTKCPICHMNLVQKKESQPSSAQMDKYEHHKDHAAVVLNQDQQGLIGLRTMTVERKPFVKKVQTVGYVLTYLEFYMEQNKFIDAYIDYVQVFRDYRRIKDRRRTWEIHRQLQAKLLEAKDKLLALGLSHEHIERLQQVSRVSLWQEPELQMFDKNTNYWVVAEIFESDLGFVDVGQEVDVYIPAYFENIKGVVRSVGGIIDPNRRTTRALIEIPQYRGHLVANMQADVRMSVELNKTLVVPTDAVIDLGTRRIVYVKDNKGSFKPVEVEVAWRDTEWVSIKSGLKENDEVVINGHFLLDSESRLQAVLEQATSSQVKGDQHVH